MSVFLKALGGNGDKEGKLYIAVHTFQKCGLLRIPFIMADAPSVLTYSKTPACLSSTPFLYSMNSYMPLQFCIPVNGRIRSSREDKKKKSRGDTSQEREASGRRRWSTLSGLSASELTLYDLTFFFFLFLSP